MDKELTEKLKERHPQIMQDLWGDPRVTCMAFGVECGNGWYNLLDDLMTALEVEANRSGAESPPRAVQIKEKFGMLRFYIDAGTDKENDIIDGFEAYSGHVCEACGKPGRVKSYRGWLAARCVDCDAKSRETK